MCQQRLQLTKVTWFWLKSHWELLERTWSEIICVNSDRLGILYFIILQRIWMNFMRTIYMNLLLLRDLILLWKLWNANIIGLQIIRKNIFGGPLFIRVLHRKLKNMRCKYRENIYEIKYFSLYILRYWKIHKLRNGRMWPPHLQQFLLITLIIWA